MEAIIFMNKTEMANDFTVLDWIGFIYIMIFIIGLFGFPILAAAFRDMYQDFGETLPILTTLVLMPWLSISLGIASIAVFSLLWHKSIKSSLIKQRAVIVISFIFSGATFGVCFFGIFQPIFNISSQTLLK